MADTSNKGGAKKGGTLLPFAIGGVAVIVALVVVIVVLAGRLDKVKEEPTPTERRSVVVNENNVNDVLDAMSEEQEQVQTGSYRAIMNTTWNFRDGTSASDNAYVENSTDNTNDVYFDVELADTEEIIYSSPVIPRGSYLEKFALDKDLDAGTYDCIITYHLIDDDQNTLSTLKMTLIIVVEG